MPPRKRNSRAADVRFSRDGDQFHYFWAARKCLQLLLPTSEVVAITIEGSSAREIQGTRSVDGEEVIDLAEYFDSEDLTQASRIHYFQLKHSTQSPNKDWTLSRLAATIAGFAAKFKNLTEVLGRQDLQGKAQFRFISNRPVSKAVLETIEDVQCGARSRHPDTLKKLRTSTKLKGELFIEFCRVLQLEGLHPNYQLQRLALRRDTHAYLPDDDVDAPIRLKELVTRKALSESADDPSIRKLDVFRALNMTEFQLYPTPSRVESLEDAIERVQEEQIAAQITSASAPVLVHAAGGVGKSILAKKLGNSLPKGSVTIVYDCFGNGEYRQRSRARHRHKDALVQVSNELAALGLCDPLLPTPKADAGAYLNAFLHRLEQSTNTVKSKDNEALVTIVIDAGDNAEMAAEEFGEHPSFARDLLRETLPDGVRLVVLCRTERRSLLNPPPTVHQIELNSFTRDESASVLRMHHPASTEHDVDEFHRLTGGNPRVQANALSQFEDLQELLKSLGPNPTTVDKVIETQLEHALDKLRDEAADKAQIELICTGLAVLRPLLPLSVLATISGAQESAIRSFVADFGRPLLINESTIQFRDEPVETWFRNKFRANKEQINSFISRLKPLSNESAYVASALPFLLLEGGHLDDLVNMALSGEGLPTNNPINRREIELQRLQFALKASLRSQDYVSATKLAFKAGGEMAGNLREQKLLQCNTDLVGTLLSQSLVHDIAFGRRFKGAWLGSEHAYEASSLSHVDLFKGEARSRLRIAYDWLDNWFSLPEEERRKERVEFADIAELMVAEFNVHGSDICATEFSRWTGRATFEVGRILARRFIDHGRISDLNALAISAKGNRSLCLSIALELRSVHKVLPKQVVRDLIAGAKKKSATKKSQIESDAILAITALVEAAHFYKVSSNKVLASILDKYLPDQPPRGLSSRYSDERYAFLSAYALRASLLGKQLELNEVAYPELRKKLEEKESQYADRDDVAEFKFEVGTVLPWHNVCAKALTCPNLDIVSKEIQEAQKTSSRFSNIGYRQYASFPNEIAKLWFDVLIRTAGDTSSLLAEFKNWQKTLSRPLSTPTLNSLARTAARATNYSSEALEFCQQAFKITQQSTDEVDSKLDTYVNCARSLLTINKAESEEYFDYAIKVASRLGDEVYPRWEAMMDLADQTHGVNDEAEVAYRFARCAEVAAKYLDDHFDWNGTIAAIGSISPSSVLAIASRWRDRRFGSLDTMLPLVTKHLLSRQLISGPMVISLLPIEARWNYPDILETALKMAESTNSKIELLQLAMRYLRLRYHHSSMWKKLEAIAKGHNLETVSIISVREYEEEEGSKRKYDDPSSGNSASVDWETIFRALNLCSVQGVSAAYEKFRRCDPLWYHENFWQQLINRIPENREVEFIRAVSESTELELFNSREFIEHIPSAWMERMSTARALSEVVIATCARHCLEITNSRNYQSFPLATARQFTLPGHDPVDAVLSALGKRIEVFDSSRLFTLVGLLAEKLSPSQAIECLRFSLEIFEEEVGNDDGDGPWSNSLIPPTNISHGLAGLLWAALGAPEPSLRWQVVHVVRCLCALNQAEVLEELINLARSRAGGPFVDSRFHFYSLHARLYLLIALARVSLENPGVLKSHTDFFVDVAINDEPHVLIRHFAAVAARELEKSGLVTHDKAVQAMLSSVNMSPFQPVDEETVRSRKSAKKGRREPYTDNTKRFHFNDDISRYWFNHVAECFGVSVPDIEETAEQVICDDWQLKENGYWNSDARSPLYRERETYHSHGSYPKTEDLSFYLSYHSMMVVAGKLLKTEPVRLSRYDDVDGDRFTSWLTDELLTRPDGRWLSDRIDPKPLEKRSWESAVIDKDWRWLVTHSDFDEVIGVNAKLRNVFGTWTVCSSSYEEEIEIRSALVSKDRSDALLRALQLADNCYSYRIPPDEDELEINDGPYQLKGWIDNHHDSNNIDKHDPWSGDIRYPALKPAQFVIDMFGLKSDEESRTWSKTSTEGNNDDVLYSEVWGTWSGEESVPAHGQRIQATPEFLQALLLKMEMDLIIKVCIGRRKINRRYERYYEEEEKIGYVEPYCKLFILRSNGRIDSLRECSRVGTETRQ